MQKYNIQHYIIYPSVIIYLLLLIKILIIGQFFLKIP